MEPSLKPISKPTVLVITKARDPPRNIPTPNPTQFKFFILILDKKDGALKFGPVNYLFVSSVCKLVY